MKEVAPHPIPPMMLPSTSTMTVSPQKTYFAGRLVPASQLSNGSRVYLLADEFFLPHIQKNITPAIRAPIGAKIYGTYVHPV